MKSKTWLIFFAICGVIEVFAEATNNRALVLISKPLLTPLLAGFAYFKANENGSKAPIALFGALLFSLLGDVILLFASGNETYFLMGLVAFLIGHIFYIALNLGNAIPIKIGARELVWFVPMLAMTGFLLVKVTSTASGLAVPIIAYSSILCTLYFTGLLTRNNLQPKHWQVLFAGIVLFIASDSMIAINRFIAPFEGAGVAIMATYIIAQYLLVLGNISRQRGQ